MQSNKESFVRQPRFLILTTLVLLAALCRLFDNMQNLAPIGAIALFGGACFRSRKAAFLVPLSAMLLSDVLLNLTRHSNQSADAWKLTAFTYAAFLLVVGVGQLLRRRTRSVWFVAGGSLAASLVFFVVTNFGWWLTMGFHPMSVSGLAECYTLALPFFRNTIASDLAFNAILFGSFALVESRILSTAPQVEAV